ncbi:NUDIX domain-containing protein [Methylomagnum ishizawai]|uniref:NUDIX domain-containing protein n=1 Tax=Methylomagnum ishizawai TaxID=1760988 RepID=UPI001C335BF0|nr:NUDIX domain-containing protein [Methylomagnum ishizawai]BBL75927.1 ADP-ribose pyrophosphatase [Methylomagnum ishizawai]
MAQTEPAFEIVEETPVYRGFFQLTRLKLRHTLYQGGWTGVLERELFHRGRAVAVIPYDPVADRVVLVEQFRVGALGVKENPWLLEIVAGAIEAGESPEQVAHRECAEEAGCAVRELIRIGEFFPTPGGCSERITLFCGLVDSAGLGGLHGLAEEHEDILASVVDFAEALAWVEQGRIDSAVPIIGLQWLALNRERLRAAS